MIAPTRSLVIFAKWPVPGCVKTRLAPQDPAWGARVARALLLDVLDRLAEVPARRVMAFAPCDAEDLFSPLARGRYELISQGDGDLGHRLQCIIAHELAAGAQACVVVGADSPTLPVELINEAFDALDHADIVLGPATDGGYYLLGCGPRVPPIFEGIAWGAATVLSETIDLLSDPNWSVHLLPPWYDVDTALDWQVLRGHVAALRRAGQSPHLRHTESLLFEAAP